MRRQTSTLGYNDNSDLTRNIAVIVREYVFYVFLKIQKNATFYVFLKRHFKKRKKNVIQKSKFQTLLTFHYMESPLQFKNNVFL